jgi:hypothetical protein
VTTYQATVSKSAKLQIIKFGINNALIIKAVNGDEKALKQIGDMGKLGERLATSMPLIRRNLKAYIEGHNRVQHSPS